MFGIQSQANLKPIKKGHPCLDGLFIVSQRHKSVPWPEKTKQHKKQIDEIQI